MTLDHILPENDISTPVIVDIDVDNWQIYRVSDLRSQ